MKPTPIKKQTEHYCSVSQDADWLVWNCHQCSRKIKSNLATDEWVIERRGELLAHHTYQ